MALKKKKNSYNNFIEKIINSVGNNDININILQKFDIAFGSIPYFSRINDINSTVGRRDKYMLVKKMIANEGESKSSRIRTFSTGPEHRVRNIYWDISEYLYLII